MALQYICVITRKDELSAAFVLEDRYHEHGDNYENCIRLLDDMVTDSNGDLTYQILDFNDQFAQKLKTFADFKMWLCEVILGLK
jgi:hypothetical protein